MRSMTGFGLGEAKLAGGRVSSEVRSLTDCIMVLAVRNSSVNSTAPTIALAMKLMSPICLSCICASADSVWVRVSYDEFANSASISLEIRVAWCGSVMPTR